METQYRIVFTGDLVPGEPVGRIIESFSARFRIGEETAREIILRGGRTVLKRDLDRARAERYSAALKKVGLLVVLEPQGQSGDVTRPLEKGQTIELPHGESLTPPALDTAGEQLCQPRSIAAGRGLAWVVEAWGLFKDNPVAWVGAILLYGLIAAVLSLVPVVGGLAMSILGPIFAGGLMIGAHAQYAGGGFEVKYLFAGFSRNTVPLALLGVAYLGFGILILLIIMLLGAGAAFVLTNAGDTAGFDLSHLDPAQLGPMVLLPLLVILLISVPLMMAVLFAPALVALNDCPVLHAFRQSFVGCWRNMLPFLVFGLVALAGLLSLAVVAGLVGLVLPLASALILAFGLLVIMPLMTIAIYVAYRDIY